MSFLVLVVTVLLSFLVYFLFEKAVSKRHVAYPPGPKPLPVLGNIFDMPKSNEYLTYTEWRRKYGDIVHVNALGKHIVILGSIEAANELLEIRSAKYSSRPYIPMLHEPGLMNSGWSFVFKLYDDDWNRHRRLFAKHMSSTSIMQHHDRLAAASHGLLRMILNMKAPEDLEAALRHVAADIIMAIAYGYDVKPKDDPFVELAARMFKEISEGISPSRYLVNMIPMLKYIPEWFPGGGFKAFARQARKSGGDVVQIPFAHLESTIASGTAKPSFASIALAEAAESGNNDPDSQTILDIKEVAATMYGGASDTTVVLAHTCILALILFPHVQRRAQLELDTVLGSSDSPLFRLPTLKDRARLPYIGALLTEVMRWWQPIPLGIPHMSTEDDVYREWHIPKGSIIIANAFAILHDEELFPDPWEFRPERFLRGPDGLELPDPTMCGFFGFGRRVCPGRPLAEDAIWIQIASLLAAFNIMPAKDEAGKEIDVKFAMTPKQDFVLHPPTFPCSLTPRSVYTEARIRETE